VGLAAASEREGQVFVHGEHAGAQLVLRLRSGAIAGPEHVGHQHDIVLAGDGARLPDRVGTNALPVGLHENDRALCLHPVIIDDHALKLPAVECIRHFLLGHRPLSCRS